MKAPTSRQLSPLVSRAFKAVGIIMILASLLDIIILPIPFQFQNREWLELFATQVVERGIVPMVGLALLFAGYWVEGISTGASSDSRLSWKSLKLWALLLSCLFALFYLMVLVLHVNNEFALRTQRLEEIQQQASQAETQLETQIETQVGQQRQRIGELLDNEALLDQVIEQGAVSEQEAQLLQQFRNNPDSFDVYLQGLQQQAETALNERQTELGMRREEAITEVKTNTLKSAIRIGLSSLLLAIGYIVIGWSGLKLLGQASAGQLPR
ncbi:MAG: hormogonium polysaccharide biosynthesis protein HpsJ [Elainellaceae cyanobacterium]